MEVAIALVAGGGRNGGGDDRGGGYGGGRGGDRDGGFAPRGRDNPYSGGRDRSPRGDDRRSSRWDHDGDDGGGRGGPPPFRAGLVLPLHC